MKKVLQALYPVLVFGCLLALALGTALQPKGEESFYENRTLAQAPVRDPATIMDGSFFPALETFLSDQIFCRESLTILGTRLDLLLRRPVVNDIVAQDDLLLPYLDYETVDPSAMEKDACGLAENLKTVSDAAKSYGGHYLYVAVPGQYSCYEDRYPDYLNSRREYMDTALPILAETLDKLDVDFLDLGPAFEAAGDPGLYSSTVDNHYSAQGAYLCYEAILNYLNQNYNEGLPVAEVTFTPIDAPYLGARARKLCGLVSTGEQLYTMTPTEAVGFTRTDNGQAVDAAVYAPETERGYITYDYFMGGDTGLTQIDTNRSDLPTVLLYGDSYTNALESVLYLSCDIMYSMDLRHYTRDSVSAFVAEYQPDYVICLRDYGVILSPEGNGGT